jgi:hypothetical protein
MTNKRSIAALLIAALFALTLNGCSNPFIESRLEKANPDASGEFGTVQISFTQGAARTVMPLVVVESLYLEYWFAKDGGDLEEKSPVGGVFALEPGNYELTVKAFVDGANEELAAQGDAEFTVASGVAADTVELTLHPVASEGAGSLEFSLEYPVGVTVETLALTRIAGEDPALDLTNGRTPSGSPLVLSGTEAEIPAGYYFLRTVLRKGDGTSTGRTEAVHIYQNLSASVSYVFVDDDFRAFRVSSTGDSGPGTLRQAITDALGMAEASQTIQVALPAGSVIELQNPLPQITKNLTIEGNGVTLTPGASWTSTATSQLLYITGGGTTTVRRVHFKDGRTVENGAAIYAIGGLIVESCIFSGNRTTGSSGYGGAIYKTGSAGGLTVRGSTFYGNVATNSGGAISANTSGLVVIFTGNLFYGNTGQFGRTAYLGSATINNANFNYNAVDSDFGTGTGQAGWAKKSDDVTITSLPVSPKTFRLYRFEITGMLPLSLPEGYPSMDFYGSPINGEGAAGAAQDSVENNNGYYLDLSVNNSALGTVATSPEPDADGFVPAGPVSITAYPGDGYDLGRWTENGADAGSDNPLTITMNAHKQVQAVFSRPVTVNIFTDGPESATTAGTLRYALTNAADGDVITFGGAISAGITTLELQSPLPQITSSLTIEGSGVILTRAASWASSDTSQLLRLDSAAAEVTIRRVHFKNGLATSEGAAIRNTGSLILESCIFSGNRVTGNGIGGAVYSVSPSVIVRGCAFYENAGGGNGGGAIYIGSGNPGLVLMGNLFYGNTAALYPVVRNSAATTAFYNAVDKALTTASDQAGWAEGTGEKQLSALPVSPASFRLLAGSEAANMLASLPAGYPKKDFYGADINAGGAAGPVQASVANPSSFYLGLAVNNAAGGTVSSNPEPDVDGLVPGGSVTITATASGGVYSFGHWLVDGADAGSDNLLTRTISGNTRVQAVFNRTVTVNSFTDTEGSETTSGTLRYALANAQNGDLITISGATPGETTIELQSPLPQITANIAINGGGVILTRKAAGWTANMTSLLLYVNSSAAEVTIRRIHFTNGLSTEGGAIRNTGILTLESCIFTGNQSNGTGGAVKSDGSLTLRGCTFYNNTATGVYGGGAVYFLGSNVRDLILTGNLFYGNRATGSNPRPVAYVNQAKSVTALYNVVDSPFGTANNTCGFEQDGGVTNAVETGQSISLLNFKPFPGGGATGKLPAVLPGDYPLKDFYDEAISANGPAGAVQTVGSGYYLDVSANNSAAGSFGLSGGTDNGGGFYASGSNVTITATPETGYVHGYWLVNGARSSEASNVLTISSLSANTWVQAIFAIPVTDYTDAAGSSSLATLRYALANAVDGDTVMFKGAPPGTTIQVGSLVQSRLEIASKGLVIEGEGVTLVRAPTWASGSSSQLLYVNLAYADSAKTVRIRRVHFKDGLSSAYGGAIYKGSYGNLILESCIFSGNQCTGSNYPGAVYSGGGILTIMGSTFYNNTGTRGGAVSGSNTTILRGNLFYGNRAATATTYPVIYSSSAIPAANASYNVVDVTLGVGNSLSGWTPGDGDTLISGLPVSPGSFRLLSGSEAAAKLSVLPAGYPSTDFYGGAISAGGAAGAVQATVTNPGYYYLDLSVNNSALGSVAPSTSADADGLYPSSVTLTASGTGGVFDHWQVNGAPGGNTNPLTLNLTDHATRVQAGFATLVTNFTDGSGAATTPGTLRHALANAQAGDIIKFDGVTPGTSTITLQSALPQIGASLTIEGNGITLAGGGYTAATIPALLQVDLYSSNGGAVTIRRVHFKDGKATSTAGGAIYSRYADLTLESCIFSGNQSTRNGGAVDIDTTGNLTVRGCTFYNNTISLNASPASYASGGAVYFTSSSNVLTMTGNLFYGNDAQVATSYPAVVHNFYGATSAFSYNVVDKAFGTTVGTAGWEIGTGDAQITGGLPVSPASFKVLSGSEAGSKLPSPLPDGYPGADFYGTAINAGGAAGAVQSSATGYYLGLSVNDSAAGTIAPSGGSLNAEGLYTSGSTVSITATPSGVAYSLDYWLIDNVKSGSANPLSVTLTGHAWVQAVFKRTPQTITVNTFTDEWDSATTVGTLRYALTTAGTEDTISFSGITPGTTTIELKSALPEIHTSLTIEGNGITLTRAASYTNVDNYSSLLSTDNSNGALTIRRVHFKDGRQSFGGGAIYSRSKDLTLESCIFSGNQTTGSSSQAGAVYAFPGNIIIRGCTFYNNVSGRSAAAMVAGSVVSTVTMTGNLFYGNWPLNPASYPGVVDLSGTTVISYNVVDRAFGTTVGTAGWNAGDGDTTFDTLTITGDPLDATFKPVSALGGVISSDPGSFPATDFFGTSRTFPGAPGAVATTQAAP